MLVFYSDCVSWPRKHLSDLEALIDKGRDISVRTFKDRIGNGAFRDLAESLGYDTGRSRGGIRLEDDCHVAFRKAPFRGGVCYYLVWSAIEYVFVPEELAYYL